MGDQVQNPPPYSHGSPPGPQPGITNVTVVPGAIVIQQNVGPDPTHITCKSCNQETVTRVKRKATTKTHIFAAILCIFACWPCVCIPYCMDSCCNADHYCSNCGTYVGTYKR